MISPIRIRRPRDKGKIEGAVLIVERWILARCAIDDFFNLTINNAIGGLLEELNNQPIRHLDKTPQWVVREDRSIPYWRRGQSETFGYTE